jgi:C-terminal processing protease CtpA/Prc
MFVVKVLGIIALIGILLALGFLARLDSLGSTDDFRITSYEATVTVLPQDKLVRVQAMLGLRALKKRSPKKISLALGIGAKVVIHSSAINGESRPNRRSSLRIPLLGERPELKIVSVTLNKSSFEELSLSLDYTLSPLERTGGFFSGIEVTEWEAKAEYKDLAFPILMFTLRDLWAIIQGDYSVLPRFGYRLTVIVPKDWEARIGFYGKVEDIIEKGDQKIFHLAAEPKATVAGLPSVYAWRALDLSLAENRVLEYEFLWQKIREIYPFFEIKGIDWEVLYNEFKPLVAKTRDEMEYYDLLQRMLARFRDGHLSLQSYPGRLRWIDSGAIIEEIEEKPIVTHIDPGAPAERAGLRPGMEILKVDGQPVAEKLVELLPYVSASTDRGARLLAYQRLTDGEPGRELALEVQDEQSEPFQVNLTLFEWGRAPSPLVEFRRLPEGFGYIKIRRWAPDRTLDEKLEQALETLKDTPGLIIDLRGNPGGTSRAWFIGRLITKRTLAGYFAVRKDKETFELTKPKAAWVTPQGPWQYDKPLVLLADGRTGSASEGFISALVGSGRVLLVGSPTKGSISETATIPLPGGARVGISSSVDYTPQGGLIEGRGFQPHIQVEPTIEDIRAGRDVVLEKAIDVLRTKQGGGSA